MRDFKRTNKERCSSEDEDVLISKKDFWKHVNVEKFLNDTEKIAKIINKRKEDDRRNQIYFGRGCI